MKKVFCLFVFLLVCACAPVTENLSTAITSASDAALNVSTIRYEASAFDVSYLIITLAPKLLPSDAHGPLVIEELSDTKILLSSKPLKGSAGVEALKAEALQISLALTEAEAYTEVSFRPEPVSYPLATKVKEELIQALNENLTVVAGNVTEN